ncbi:unnamed protein product, partial [marine sediment metagenome]
AEYKNPLKKTSSLKGAITATTTNRILLDMLLFPTSISILLAGASIPNSEFIIYTYRKLTKKIASSERKEYQMVLVIL